MILEQVTGKSLQQYTDKNIFKPLGMNSSHFHSDYSRLIPNKSMGHMLSNFIASPEQIDERHRYFSDYMTILDIVGDSGLYTTIDDMRKWTSNLITKKVFGAKFINDLTTPYGVTGDGKYNDYAFGMYVVDEYKFDEDSSVSYKALLHRGWLAGYSTRVAVFPEEEISFIVFCNRADGDAADKAYEISKLYFPQPKPNTIVALSKSQKQYTGDFWDKENQSLITISIKKDEKDKKDKLFLRYISTEFKPLEYEMQATGENRFQLFPMNTSLQYDEDTITITLPERKIKATRLIMPAAHTTRSSTFDSYLGRYHSEEAQSDFCLYRHKTDNRLMLDIGGERRPIGLPIAAKQLRPLYMGTIILPYEFHISLEFFAEKEGGITGEPSYFLLDGDGINDLKFVHKRPERPILLDSRCPSDR
ncbi:MAG: hypothetical protein ACI8WB_003368 [Phenylobacterium sp.]|jgi:hypothetical protein